MAGWSEVEKESGLVPAAEVAPYTWAHRFLPEEAAKLSAGGNVLGKVPLPWLHLVARSNSCEFTWTHLDGIRRLKGNKQVVFDVKTNWKGVIATPQVSEGTKWFEVRIINPGPHMLVGWSPSDVHGKVNSFSNSNGCAWCVRLTHIQRRFRA